MNKKTLQLKLKRLINNLKMICRSCGGLAKKIYSSSRLPECIWPTKIKTNFSSCNIYSCIKCCHLQLQNFSKKKILKFYGDTQYVLDKTKTNKSRLLLILKKYGRLFFKNKKILDVGGGINPLYINNNSFIADIKIQKFNKHIFKNKYYEINIEEKKIKNKFDIIFLMHTLEHFKYPSRAIQNLKTSLKNDGRIFIEIPNFNFNIRKQTYYAIFHQHLSMFTIGHLKNFLILNDLCIENIFIKKDVIFCSVKFSRSKIKLKHIDNKKIIIIFKKNLNLMKKKILNHLQNNKFDIYGAGGSMVLLISLINNLKKNISNIYDSQSIKHLKLFPGTNIRILKNKKSNLKKNFFSISSYKLKKKNNLFIEKI